MNKFIIMGKYILNISCLLAGDGNDFAHTS